MRSNRITVALAVALVVLAGLSLFVGVIELDLQALLRGDGHAWEIFLLSVCPELLAILCTGAGMSVAGLIMQQLCSDRFVSPTTGATHTRRPSWAFCWHCCSGPAPPCGEGRYWPLQRPLRAPGRLCGSSSASGSRMR